MPEPTLAYFQGNFRPFDQAKISIRSKALQYGLGCFEGIRAYWNRDDEQLYIFRAVEHFERLHESCRILHLPLKESVKDLVAITVELLRRNNHREDTYIRPIFFNNSETLAPALTEDNNELAIYTLQLQDYFDTTKGLTACISSWRRVGDNMIPARAKPTAAYLNSALARFEAKSNGYDEAIFLTHDGYVSEGSAEHLFIIRGGKLVTPTSQEDNLDGITRRTLAELARDVLHFPVEERRISRTELYVAEEAFLCGTGAQVTPLTAIDRRVIGDGKCGPMTRRLMDLYSRVVRGKEPKYARWCTPVYPAA